MKRSLLWCAPLLIAGCRNSPQAIDPFLPRTTVPPPATGAAVGTPAPYDSPPSAAGAPYTPPGGSYDYSQPANGPVGTPYQGETNQYPADRFPMTNRGTTNRQSSNSPASQTKPAVVRSHLAAASSAAGVQAEPAEAKPGGRIAEEDTENRVVQTGHSKIVKVIHSHSSQTDSGDTGETPPRSVAAQQEPRRLPATDDAVDIMDLPPARTASAGSRMAQRIASSGGGKVVRASHSEPAPRASAARSTPVEPFAAQRYAYSPGYKKLNGQLEYSLAEHRWKMRYIPIDGETDSHGGSVVLLGKLPEQFQAGDFVTVEGRLAGDAAPGEFAPPYQFDAIEPLAD